MENLFFIYLVFIITFLTIFNSGGNWFSKKRLDKKLSEISSACWVLKINDIDLIDKGVIFHVKVEDKKDSEKISYISPYSATNVYINNELVCKLHRLDNFFIKQRTVEYAENRSEIEIDKIISRAYKIAKKEKKQYYDNDFERIRNKSKSFYDK